MDSLNLTSAELRTLRYLPTHHSFKAIGEQLFLSQNTIKTQANSLYRKLGVKSRAEAVMEGRRLGILEKLPD
jgi:LuxR family maltose regulon positive regulatory protein